MSLNSLIFIPSITELYVCIGNSIICSDISKLLYVISRGVRRMKFKTILKITSGIYAKYHVQIKLLFSYTTTPKSFVIFTCRYFKLS